MNVAALGNQICHLHWHIIPRYQADPRWGAPIWTTQESEMQIVELRESEHQELVRCIRAECV
jgi:diadenosine tetraphosphate (Ap4A) HIT family hydrolase